MRKKTVEVELSTDDYDRVKMIERCRGHIAGMQISNTTTEHPVIFITYASGASQQEKNFLGLLDMIGNRVVPMYLIRGTLKSNTVTHILMKTDVNGTLTIDEFEHEYQTNKSTRRIKGQATSKDMIPPQVFVGNDKESASETGVIRNAQQTQQYTRMLLNVGKRVGRRFFNNGNSGPTSIFKGVVKYVTEKNLYHIEYEDNDSQEFTEDDFKKYYLPVEVPKGSDKDALDETLYVPTDASNMTLSPRIFPCEIPPLYGGVDVLRKMLQLEHLSEEQEEHAWRHQCGLCLYCTTALHVPHSIYTQKYSSFQSREKIENNHGIHYVAAHALPFTKVRNLIEFGTDAICCYDCAECVNEITTQVTQGSLGDFYMKETDMHCVDRVHDMKSLFRRLAAVAGLENTEKIHIVFKEKHKEYGMCEYVVHVQGTVEETLFSCCLPCNPHSNVRCIQSDFILHVIPTIQCNKFGTVLWASKLYNTGKSLHNEQEILHLKNITELLLGDLGSKWEKNGSEIPSGGTEINNEALAEALTSKVEFNKEEFDTFALDNLSRDSYIKVGEWYYTPVVRKDWSEDKLKQHDATFISSFDTQDGVYMIATGEVYMYMVLRKTGLTNGITVLMTKSGHVYCACALIDSISGLAYNTAPSTPGHIIQHKYEYIEIHSPYTKISDELTIFDYVIFKRMCHCPLQQPMSHPESKKIRTVLTATATILKDVHEYSSLKKVKMRVKTLSLQMRMLLTLYLREILVSGDQIIDLLNFIFPEKLNEDVLTVQTLCKGINDTKMFMKMCRTVLICIQEKLIFMSLDRVEVELPTDDSDRVEVELPTDDYNSKSHGITKLQNAYKSMCKKQGISVSLWDMLRINKHKMKLFHLDTARTHELLPSHMSIANIISRREKLYDLSDEIYTNREYCAPLLLKRNMKELVSALTRFLY